MCMFLLQSQVTFSQWTADVAGLVKKEETKKEETKAEPKKEETKEKE